MILLQIVNGAIRLNKLVVKISSIEAMEWQEVFEEDEDYQIRFHTSSGKLYTRRGSKETVKELIKIFQNDYYEEEEE